MFIHVSSSPRGDSVDPLPPTQSLRASVGVGANPLSNDACGIADSEAAAWRAQKRGGSCGFGVVMAAMLYMREIQLTPLDGALSRFTSAKHQIVHYGIP